MAKPIDRPLESGQGRIAFTRYGGRAPDREVFLVDAEGQDLLSLGTPEGWAWSPDGRQLAQSDAGRVYLVDAETGKMSLLTPDSDRNGHPRWSPDGSRLAFLSGNRTTQNGQGVDLHVVELDSTEWTRVPVVDARLSHDYIRRYSPIWSPNGTHLALALPTLDGRDDEVFIVNTDSGKLLQITNNTVQDDSLVWSLDGKTLVYKSELEQHSRVMLVEADGSNPRSITDPENRDGPYLSPNLSSIASVRKQRLFVGKTDTADLSSIAHVDGPPIWSPDSSRLAFIGYVLIDDHIDPATRGLYTVTADGNHLDKLIDLSDQYVRYWWSPDSRRVSFCLDGLWVVGADGTGLIQLAQGCVSTAWSPDSNLIAFGGEVDGNPAVLVVDVSTGSMRTMTGSIDTPDHFAWSPDGKHLLFSVYHTPNIFVIDESGGNEKQLTFERSSHNYAPTWSPDGRRIAFKSGSNSLSVMDPDGTNRRDNIATVSTVLYEVLYDVSSPWVALINEDLEFPMAWAPDSTAIAFADHDALRSIEAERGTYRTTGESTPGGDTSWDTFIDSLSSSPYGSCLAIVRRSFGQWVRDVFIVDTDDVETPAVPITKDFRARSITWSPDGTKLAFGGKATFGSQEKVFVVSPTGEDLEEVADGLHSASQPVWSPDGDRLAFIGARETTEVYVVEASGGDLRQLTSDSYLDSGVQWSSDGDKLVYSSFRDGDWEIIVMDEDGGNARQLTDNHYHDYQPVWMPTG